MLCAAASTPWPGCSEAWGTDYHVGHSDTAAQSTTTTVSDAGGLTMWAIHVTPDHTGTLDSINVVLGADWDGSDSVYAYIYASNSNDSAAYPTTRLAISSVGVLVTGGGGGGDLIKWSFPITCSLTSGTMYWIGIYNASATNLMLSAVSTSPYQTYNTDDWSQVHGHASSIPNPWSVTSADHWREFWQMMAYYHDTPANTKHVMIRK
jgi:hypothetical protein